MSDDELVIPCEVYSRIVGYLRPVQDWSEAKRVEFAERKLFEIPKGIDEEDTTLAESPSKTNVTLAFVLGVDS